MIAIATNLSLIEEILAAWAPQLGADLPAYKNHVYRMAHFCFAQHPCAEPDREKVVIAACFHDLGIWSDGTLDYLPPSVRLAADYLTHIGKAAWIPEITLMIDMHHKLRRYDDVRYPLVEAFRKADITDFSMGLLRMGLPRSDIRAVQATFPNHGFHRRLVGLGTGWFLKHPLNPLPFFRF